MLVAALVVVFSYFSVVILFVFFFFSSRRRHTRCLSDWSSDVCSSDLPIVRGADGAADGRSLECVGRAEPASAGGGARTVGGVRLPPARRARAPVPGQIGRASCRERRYSSADARTGEKREEKSSRDIE